MMDHTKPAQWFRMYAEFATDPKVQMLSDDAKHLSLIAHKLAYEGKTCYPNWRKVEKESGLCGESFMSAFEELCNAGVVFHGFPSLLVAYAEAFPLISMFGPSSSGRPSAYMWSEIRARIFERDNYTCAYCGDRGVHLECDHIIPVSRGGGHDDENLVTACRACNRSKSDKLINEWGGR